MQSIRPMSAVFIIENRKLLLVHNVKHGLRVEPPGGKVHAGETFEAAAIREAKEELGIDITLGELFSSHQIDTPEGRFDVRLFLATIIAGQPTVMEPEKIDAFHWYSWEELEQNDRLVPDLKEALSALRKLLVN